MNCSSLTQLVNQSYVQRSFLNTIEIQTKESFRVSAIKDPMENVLNYLLVPEIRVDGAKSFFLLICLINLWGVRKKTRINLVSLTLSKDALSRFFSTLSKHWIPKYFELELSETLNLPEHGELLLDYFEKHWFEEGLYLWLSINHLNTEWLKRFVQISQHHERKENMSINLSNSTRWVAEIQHIAQFIKSWGLKRWTKLNLIFNEMGDDAGYLILEAIKSISLPDRVEILLRWNEFSRDLRYKFKQEAIRQERSPDIFWLD